MAKKGVYKITGNTHPKTGEKTIYTVTEWYPDTPNSDRREVLVTWELFKKNDKGQFVTTHLKKKGVGEFTFAEQAYKSTFMVEGYLHSPEGKEPMAIIVHPQKNDGPTSKEKDILGVRLTYQDGSTITKALSYMDRLHATVKCQNLEGHYITLSLWEDDEKHEGHNKKNQFITKSPPIHVDSKGYARWNFTLLSTYISIANKREDDKKQHEYYILAEYNGKLQASDNVNVNNPEYKIPPPPSKPAHAKKPQPKPDTPKGSTHQSSRNNQPDKKGIIKKITLVDKDGKPFKRRPTFGQTIKLIIEAENVVGKKYNLKLWEHDSWGGDDLLYNNTHTFKADRQEILIPLTSEMQTIGEIGIDPNNPNYGEYWTGNWQEIYAEVTLLYISTKSPIINVDIEEKPKVLDNGRSPWKKEKSEVVKASSTCICQEQYKDLVWGGHPNVSCEFRKKVVQICAELWGESKKMEMANGLMAVMYVESATTFSASKIELKPTGKLKSNGKPIFAYRGLTKNEILNLDENFLGAVGLIQFIQVAIDELNKKFSLNLTKKKLALMTEVEQLDYVKKYFKLGSANTKIKTPEDIYLHVFAPIGVGKPEDYVLYKKHINPTTKQEKIDNKNYNANKSVDIENNNDDKIQKSEILGRYRTSFSQGLTNKETNFSCETQLEKKEQKSCVCQKKHIDLSDKIKWQTQFDSQWGDKKKQNIACWKASQQILTNLGLGKLSGYPDGYIALAKEINQHTELEYMSNGVKEGIKYIDSELEKGHPVLIGVNHDLNYRGEGNNDHTTDHFVVIIGRGCDTKPFYLFYDVGTRYEAKGASDSNKLYIYENRIEGKTAYDTSKTYTVAQVRKNR